MSKEPRRNVYVGHRYVPLVIGEWDKTETYEGLSIVTYQGASYTSKKRVPRGIDILNKEYWALTGNYNAQIEEYRKDVHGLKDDVTKVEKDITDLDGKVTTEINNFKTDVNNNFNSFKSDVDQSLTTHKNEVAQDLTSLENTTNQKINTINSNVDKIEDNLLNKAPYHDVNYEVFYDKSIETTCYLTHVKRESKNGKKVSLKYDSIINKHHNVVEHARENNTTLSINAGMFNSSGTEIDYDVIIDGKIIKGSRQALEYRHYLAIDENGNLSSYPTTTLINDILNDGIKYAVSGFVPMYENGSKKTSLMQSYNEFNERHPRQIILQDVNNDYFILTIGGRGVDGQGATLLEAYDIAFRKISNIKFMYNLDGGGSNQTVIRGNMINPSYSAVNAITGGELRERPDVLYIEKSDSVSERDLSLERLSNDILNIQDELKFLSGVQYGEWLPALGSEHNYIEDSIQYDHQEGKYIRIGNIVFAFYDISVINKGTASGIIRIRNLPGANNTENWLNSRIDYYEGLINPLVTDLFMEQTNSGTMQIKGFLNREEDSEVITRDKVNINYTSVQDSFRFSGLHVFPVNADFRQR